MKSDNPRRPPTAPGGVDDGADRHLFVLHQQELARRALSFGSPGAARAALRALQAGDFKDATGAVDSLRVIRDASATQDEVTEAVKQLLRIEPVGGFPIDGHPTVRLSRLGR